MGDKANAKKNHDCCRSSMHTWVKRSFKRRCRRELLWPKKLVTPVILKATAGGGGRGMRIIAEDSAFQAAWDSARQEAGAAFGTMRCT